TSIYIEFDSLEAYRLHNANVQYSTDDTCGVWYDIGGLIHFSTTDFLFSSITSPKEDVRCLRYIGDYHTGMDSNPSFRIVEFDVTGYPSI
ncbi:MAG: hypothetical protein KAJ54_03600, partial [Candidatus Aenigmarchaeota archaeon]|nr:hypothetical protein [Candidatus Aenigmarchaeota archaeon]